MSRSIRVQELVDWFLIHLDDWVEPVMVKDLAEVDSGWNRNHFVAAMKHLHTAELIYKFSEDTHGLIRWLPTARRPVCAIQQYLCKGRFI